MTELSQQLQLLPAIGTDQEHCPMMLSASVSTLETMLSLSVTDVDEGAGASPSPSRAIATAAGVGAATGWCHDILNVSGLGAALLVSQSARPALSTTVAAPPWWRGPTDREPYWARIEDSEKVLLLNLIVCLTYFKSQ